jgi:hypothetical protein
MRGMGVGCCEFATAEAAEYLPHNHANTIVVSKSKAGMPQGCNCGSARFGFAAYPDRRSYTHLNKAEIMFRTMGIAA